MRGSVLLTTLALTLSLFGAAQAASTSPSLDADETVDDALAGDQLPLDLRFLPNVLRQQAADTMSASLPGPNDDLQPQLDLMSVGQGVQDASAFDIPHAASLAEPSAETTDEHTVATMDGEKDATDAEADADGSADYPTAYEGPMPTDGSDDGGETTTQAAGASQPSASSSAADAWNDLSKTEKAAVGAGLLSLLVLGPLTMYSRIKRDDALENDTRREIYELVEANPGMCIKDAADEADVSYSTASYHLDRLVKMDYVARREEGNKVLYYKNGGTFTKQEQELVPILKNAEAMRVFEHILENPWCYRAEVAEALDVSHTTINWHLERLEDASLVEEHREGRSCHLHIPQDALDRVIDVVEKLEQMGVDEDYAKPAQPPEAVPA